MLVSTPGRAGGTLTAELSNNVAEGEGCPQCGMGRRTPEEVRQAAKPGILFLLRHPDKLDKPGLAKIGLTYRTLIRKTRASTFPREKNDLHKLSATSAVHWLAGANRAETLAPRLGELGCGPLVIRRRHSSRRFRLAMHWWFDQDFASTSHLSEGAQRYRKATPRYQRGRPAAAQIALSVESNRSL